MSQTFSRRPAGTNLMSVDYSSGFARVSRRRHCLVCGKPDWCVYTRDRRVSICMRVSIGSLRMNDQGGYVHVHEEIVDRRVEANPVDLKVRSVPLASVEVRDAVYRELIRLSPVSNYDRELVKGVGGLLSRGFTAEHLHQFGALPAAQSERAGLVKELRRFAAEVVPHSKMNGTAQPLLGVPGFWQDADENVRLWKDRNYKYPFLIIPYRNGEGQIQGCQLRQTGPKVQGKNRYCWLSSANEPHGASAGDPLHFTFLEMDLPPAPSPLLVTEGALKAEALVALRPRAYTVAAAGVGNSRRQIISATRDHDTYIGFDSDHQSNPAVCGQLASLIAERDRDAVEHGTLPAITRVIVWEGGAKGIDDAALAGLHMKALKIPTWYETLRGEPKERVREVWSRLGYNAGASLRPELIP